MQDGTARLSLHSTDNDSAAGGPAGSSASEAEHALTNFLRPCKHSLTPVRDPKRVQHLLDLSRVPVVKDDGDKNYRKCRNVIVKFSFFLVVLTVRSIYRSKTYYTGVRLYIFDPTTQRHRLMQC